MANELTVTASIGFNKSGVTQGTVGAAWTNAQFNVAGTTYIESSILVPTSATVVPLGAVTNPHWAFFQNMDPTNYLQLQNGVSGAVFLRLKPGEFAIVPLDTGCVPYAIASTASCLMNYLIVSN
jgi:hypothetical protein